VLELLDFVLGANAHTFQTVAIFEHALLSRVRTPNAHRHSGTPHTRAVFTAAPAPMSQFSWVGNWGLKPWTLRVPQVCHLLLAQLSDLLDPTIEGHAQLGHLRVVQRCSRTVLRCFHTQLGAKCGAFIEVLLSGAPDGCGRRSICGRAASEQSGTT
jgi:hypothetical protein